VVVLGFALAFDAVYLKNKKMSYLDFAVPLNHKPEPPHYHRWALEQDHQNYHCLPHKKIVQRERNNSRHQ